MSKGIVVGPGHQGAQMASGGEIDLDAQLQGDLQKVTEASLLSQKGLDGVHGSAPDRIGTFHTHPTLTGLSEADLDTLLQSRDTGFLMIQQPTDRGKPAGVNMVIMHEGGEITLPSRSSTKSYTPEQLAYVLDRAAPGKAAVYTGASLTSDLTRVQGSPEGLSKSFLRKMDRMYP